MNEVPVRPHAKEQPAPYDVRRHQETTRSIGQGSKHALHSVGRRPNLSSIMPTGPGTRHRAADRTVLTVPQYMAQYMAAIPDSGWDAWRKQTPSSSKPGATSRRSRRSCSVLAVRGLTAGPLAEARPRTSCCLPRTHARLYVWSGSHAPGTASRRLRRMAPHPIGPSKCGARGWLARARRGLWRGARGRRGAGYERRKHPWPSLIAVSSLSFITALEE